MPPPGWTDPPAVRLLLDIERATEEEANRLLDWLLVARRMIDEGRRGVLPRGEALVSAIAHDLRMAVEKHLAWIAWPHRQQISHHGAYTRLPLGCMVRFTDAELPVLILELPEVFSKERQGHTLWGWRADEAELIRELLQPEYGTVKEEWNGPPGNDGTARNRDGEGASTWSLRLETNDWVPRGPAGPGAVKLRPHPWGDQ